YLIVDREPPTLLQIELLRQVEGKRGIPRPLRFALSKSIKLGLRAVENHGHEFSRLLDHVLIPSGGVLHDSHQAAAVEDDLPQLLQDAGADQPPPLSDPSAHRGPRPLLD